MAFRYNETIQIRIDKSLKTLLKKHAKKEKLSSAAMLRKMISDYNKSK